MYLIVSILLDVSLNPDPSKLPGGGTLADLGNGLLGWGLIMTAVAFGFGAASWAVGDLWVRNAHLETVRSMRATR